METYRNWSSIGSTVVAVLAFMVVNLTGHEVLSRYRLDLTEHKLYTLTDGTVNILKNLSEPVTLKFFVSISELLELPGINSYAQRVEDLLHEYALLSDGKITVRIIEPEQFSEEEDLAVGHGLQGIPTGSGSLAYLGLVGTNSVDDTQSIPIFFPEREELLEYDLTKLIFQLDERRLKVVGVLSSLPIQGTGGFVGGSAPQQPPWSFLIQMNNFFDIQLLSTKDEKLPDGLDLLVLIHPKNLSERLLYQIDQFVLGGKSVLIFVDPFSEVLSSMLGQMPQLATVNTGSDLNLLTENWGVTLEEAKIVGDLPIAARVLEGDGSSGKTIDYPVWMNIQPEQLSASDPVTSRLGNVIMATAGVLKIDPDSTLQIEPLIQTSPSATLYDYEQFSSTANIRELLENYQEGGKRMIMSVRISGETKTAFTQGPPKSDAENFDEQITVPQIMKGQVNAIIFTDTDFLHDRFWIQQQQMLGQTIAYATASNGDLIHNAVDNLSGDSNLIGVRSRGSYFRPFQRMQEIRQAAERQFLAHETRLREELSRIEALLSDYSSSQANQQGERILTNEQRQEIKQIRQNQLQIRKELRDVQHKLGQDIKRVETIIVMLNVLAMPLLVIFAGVFAGIYGWKLRNRKLLMQVTDIVNSR